MKIWPARSKALKDKDVEPVTDLDAIVAEKIPFRFQGKIHYIKPIALDEFLKFTNAQAQMSVILNDKSSSITAQELANQYYKIISAVCDSITLEDILNMEQAQVAALYQLVLDAVTGQVDVGSDGKKKRKKLQIYESVARSSSPNAVENSAGPHRKL